MRVDFVSPRFHPTTGGIEASMEGLAAELLARGHEVTVHTTHFPELALDEPWKGIRIRRYKPFPHLGYYASRFRPQLDGDVVHLHAYAHLTNDWVVRRWAGRKPIFLSTHHGIAFPKPRPWSRIYHAAYNAWVGARNLRRLAGLLVPTKWDADQFARRGVPAERIHVFPTGIPDEEFEAPLAAQPPGTGNRPYALYLGRLHPEKGVLDLVRAYEREERDFDLVLAGRDDGARSALEAWRRRSPVGARVQIVGELGRREKRARLDGSLFLVLPSHHEGQGIVVAEAWARRKAVLATSAGALEGWLRADEDALVVPPHDVDALARGLARLSTDGALRERLATRGRARAEHEFRRGPLAERLLALYGQALSAGGG